MGSASIFTGYISWFLGVCISTLLALAGKYWIDIFLDRKARQISYGCYGIDDGFLLTITLCNTSNKTMRIDKPGLLHRKEHGSDMAMASLGLRTESDTRSQVNSTTCVLTNPLISASAPLIENHADNFLEIIVKFLKCLALTVCTRKARDIAYIEPVSGQRSTTAV